MAKRSDRKQDKNEQLFQELQSAFITADSLAQKPENIEKILHITEPNWLKTNERKLSKAGKTLSHFILFGHLMSFQDTDMRNACASSYLQRKCPEPIYNALRLNCIQLWRKMLYPDITYHEDTASLVEFLKDLEQKIPDGFYDDDILGQQYKHAESVFVDPLSQGLYDIIDWDTVIESKDYVEYAKNAMKLIESTCSADIITAFEQKRNEIIQHTIKQFLRIIPNCINDSKRHLCAKGHIKQYTPPVFNPLIVKPTPMPDFNLFDPTNVSEISEDILDAEPWIIAAYGVTCIKPIIKANQFKDETIKNFTVEELTFTALSLLVQTEDIGIFTPLTDTILTELLLLRGATDTVKSLLTQNKGSDAYWAYNTLQSAEFPDDMVKKIRTEADAQKSLATTSYDLTNIALLNAHTFVPPIVHINHQYMNLIQRLGYTETEAAAFCGYIEGISAQSQNIKTAAAFLQYDIQAKTAEEKYHQEQDDAKQQLAELTTKYKALQEQTTSEIQKTQQKHKKEQQLLRHTAVQTDTKLQAITEQNEKLAARIKKLEAERLQMQNTITELSLKTKDQTDLTQNDEESMTQYPSDIGKNHKIICFGGSDNWVAEQQRRFPYIEFHECGDTMNPASIPNADIVFVNIFVLTHGMYLPLKNEADRVKKNLYVFPARGINSSSNYILKTFEEYFENQTLSTKE